MRAGLLICAGLSAAAVAQPHKKHHHAKRQDIVVVTDYVTATTADVIVYVDGNGNPISTGYAGQAAPTPTQESIAAAVAPSSYAEPTSETTSEAATSASPPPPPPSSTEAPPPTSDPTSDSSSSAAPATTGTSGTDGRGWAFSYSPYNADHSCKTQDQVNADLASMADGSMVRLYGTDCNQTATVLSAAGLHNMQVFATVWDPTDVDNELELIKDATKGDWSRIHTVAIGNEGVNDGRYSVDQVVSAIGTARSTLGSAGYNGSFVTVDTFVTMINNPELCIKSDFAAANCHAFFDGGVEAGNAGPWVLEQAQRVSAACGGKNTMITESGWPSYGETNRLAVPSQQNQNDAISSLKGTFTNGNIVLFSAFNDKWKTNWDGSFGAEQYWGIFGNAPDS